jgi:hypothetical protein
MKHRQVTACPTPEKLIKAFQGEMSLSERTSVLRHVVECPDCARKTELLQSLRLELKDKVDNLARSLDRDALADGSPGPVGLRRLAGRSRAHHSEKSRFRGMAWKLAASAAALLVCFSAGYLLWKSLHRESGIRSAGSASLVLLRPLGLIAEPPGYLEWTPVRKADIYHVRLTDTDLRVILEESPRTTRFLIPADRIRSFRRGVSYTWAVTAYDDSNNILDKISGTFIIALPGH